MSKKVKWAAPSIKPLRGGGRSSVIRTKPLDKDYWTSRKLWRQNEIPFYFLVYSLVKLNF
jgi:hypothetical protein